MDRLVIEREVALGRALIGIDDSLGMREGNAGDRPKRKTVLPDFRARLRRIYGTKIISAAVMADILAENKGRF